MGERTEVLMRILVFIVTGFILEIWKILIVIFTVANALLTLISGQRSRDLAEMSELWNTQKYLYIRYIVFQSNKRPWPFTPLARKLSAYEKK